MMRVLLSDARTVIGGVCATLLLALVVTRWTGPEAHLSAFLRALPSDVSAVVIDAERSSAARALLDALLRLPPAVLPAGVPPVAALVLAGERGEQSAALVTPDVAARAGLVGVPRGALLLVGGNGALPEVASEEGRPALPPEVLQFFRRSPGSRVRALLRTSWLATRVPALALPAGAPEFLAVSAEASSRQLRFSAVMPSAGVSPSARSRTLLAGSLPGELLVLDGLSAAELLPAKLPPILDALRAESGAGAELQALGERLGDRPVAVVVRAAATEFPDVVVATVAEAGRGGWIESAARALLERRLALSSAVTEQLRSGQKVIRHLRPALAAAGGLREAVVDGWRLLEAPRAAGPKDLLVARDGDRVLIGTSRTAVLDVGRVLRLPGSRVGAPLLAIALDGELLRRESLAVRVLEGVPSDLDPWVRALGMLHVTATGGRGVVEITGTAEFPSGIGAP